MLIIWSLLVSLRVHVLCHNFIKGGFVYDFYSCILQHCHFIIISSSLDINEPQIWGLTPIIKLIKLKRKQCILCVKRTINPWFSQNQYITDFYYKSCELFCGLHFQGHIQIDNYMIEQNDLDKNEVQIHGSAHQYIMFTITI